MLTEHEARDLLARAAATIDVPPNEPVSTTVSRRRRILIPAAAAAAAALIVGVGAAVMPDDPFPTRPTATYSDGSSAVTYRSIGEYVATAAYVFEGKVEDVERGDLVRYADGSGVEIIPRILVVEVRKVLHRRGPRVGTPETLRVNDGYWQDGVGYARQSMGWATTGQAGFFLVARDRAPDGTLMSTYSPLGGVGIALVDGESVEYADEGVWTSLGEAATAAEFREALNQGVAAARSGAAKPVPGTICWPSVPGDENSKPVCVTN